ncbi:MAG: hypothetical protein ACOCUY_00125 [Verrucomicrobiota bacterium]
MSHSYSLAVKHSSSLKQATTGFIDAVGAWAERVMRSHPDGVPAAGHDAGTFMLPWASYVEAAGDKRPLEFMRLYRDTAKQHFEESGGWLDGYWRRQEVHHGTEHFDLFLRAVWQLAPDDAETVRQLEDAAEHIGNWKPGFPSWFDWETGLFRSMFLGTEVVGDPSMNIPDHIRMVSLCLLGHDMTANARYLELAKTHTKHWTDGILAGKALPAAVDAQGPLFVLGKDESTYRSFAGAAPSDLSDNLPRAENMIASGFPEVLLCLWQKTGDDNELKAAERIIDIAIEVLDNPVAWQVHAAVRRYREVTGSERYDQRVRGIPDKAFRGIDQLTIIPEPETRCISSPLGMRGDKPDWLDQDGNPAPSPLLWTLKAAVTKDEKLLTRAQDLGLAHFRLAEQAFGDITSHGCGSRSLVAVCRGHGRLNGAGVVSEVLAPALQSHFS